RNGGSWASARISRRPPGRPCGSRPGTSPSDPGTPRHGRGSSTGAFRGSARRPAAHVWKIWNESVASRPLRSRATIVTTYEDALKTNETLYVPQGYVSVVWFAHRLDPVCGVAFSTNAAWPFGVTSTWTLARPTLSEARNST